MLHTHAVTLNFGIREDGSSGTLSGIHLYRLQKAGGFIYQADLAKGFLEDLGLSSSRINEWFELDAVPAQLCKELSSRRAEILEEIKSTDASPEARDRAALTTRKSKITAPRAAVFSNAKEIANQHGFTLERALDAAKGYSLNQKKYQAAKNHALNGATQSLEAKQSHFSLYEFIAEVACEAQALGTGALIDEAKSFLLNSENIVRLGQVEGIERFTTRTIWDLEKTILYLARENKFSRSHLIHVNRIEKAIASIENNKGFTLLSEQREALTHITQTPGSVKVISGMPGTGKTVILEAAKEAWQEKGFQVLGCALSGKAAQGLEQATGIKSTTIAKTILEIERGDFQKRPQSKFMVNLKYATHQFTKKQQKYFHWQRKRAKFNFGKKTVLIVDEAAMVDTPQMAKLMKAVIEKRGKIVLVGDEKQLQPIGPGGAFKAIADEVGKASLEKIMRQRGEFAWAADMVKAIGEGSPEKAVKTLKEKNLIHTSNSKTQAMNKLINTWAKEGGIDSPQHHLIFSSTRAEAQALNKLAQNQAMAQGMLEKRNIKLNGNKFHKGDRILFTKNSSFFGVRNGSLATIERVNPLTNQIVARIDGCKKRASINTRQYKSINLGYAMTTHKGQGITIEGNTYVLFSPTLQNLHYSYVQLSRAKRKSHIFTTVKDLGTDMKKATSYMQKDQYETLANDICKKVDQVEFSL